MENQVIDNNQKKVSAGRIARIVFFILGFVVFVLGIIFFSLVASELKNSHDAGAIGAGIFMMISVIIVLIGLVAMALAYFWHRAGDKSHHWIRNLILIFVIIFMVAFIFSLNPYSPVAFLSSWLR